MLEWAYAVIGAAVLVPLSLLVGMFIAEIIAGLGSCTPSPPLARAAARSAHGPIAVVVPAHDEALVIAQALLAIQRQLATGDRLLVVAHNCSDQTAEIARHYGAEVVLCQRPEQRGKGFALAAARAALADQPPQTVIVIDADCEPQPGAIAALAAACQTADSVAQAAYLLRLPSHDDPLIAVSCFAFMIRNLVRQQGLQRLFGSANLTGAGMAFAWQAFARARLATSDIVEDRTLGIELAASGVSIRFVPDAVILSDPAYRSAMVAQRARWDRGHLGAARRLGVAMLIRSLRTRNRALFGVAADLTVPPLVLLLGATAACGLLIAVGTAITGTVWPLLWAAMLNLLLGAAIIGAIRRAGHDYLPAGMLWRLPGYAIWKLPLYGRTGAASTRSWVRTRRDGDGRDEPS